MGRRSFVLVIFHILSPDAGYPDGLIVVFFGLASKMLGQYPLYKYFMATCFHRYTIHILHMEKVIK
jgi:hypothetical protein